MYNPCKGLLGQTAARENRILSVVDQDHQYKICKTTIEMVQKLIDCVVVVKQGESIVHITEPNRRATVVAEYLFLH